MNDNDDKAREGVEHLQSAAFEVIAALRSFLDLAEGIVRDPAQAAAVVASMAEAARADQPGNTGGDEPAPPGVTRIPLS